MAIPIDQYEYVGTLVIEYRQLIKIREGLATGELVIETVVDGNHYDLVNLFGADPIRAVLLPAYDSYMAGKKAELEGFGIQT